MSSGCGDVLSLADLQTAKKHQIFEAEVITGKSGGVAGGADIDYATNQVTGQLQKTLPAVLRDAGFSPVSWDFSTGGTLTVNDRDKVVYDPVSKTWYSYAGTLPVTVPASFNPVGNAYWKPQTDPYLRDELSADTGYDLVGKVTDFDSLRSLTPSAEGARVILKSYYINGISGGGEFVSRSTIGLTTPPTDDGGVIAVVSSLWYWERVDKENVTVDDFGAVSFEVQEDGSLPSGATSSSSAFQNMFDSLGKIKTPDEKGRGYLIDRPVLLQATDYWSVNLGESTIVKTSTTTTGLDAYIPAQGAYVEGDVNCVFLIGGNDTCRYWTFSGGYIDCHLAPSGNRPVGIYMPQVVGYYIEKVRTRGCKHGLWVKSGWLGGINMCRFSENTSHGVFYDPSRYTSTGSAAAKNQTATSLHVSSSYVADAEDDGWHMDSCQYINFQATACDLAGSSTGGSSYYFRKCDVSGSIGSEIPSSSADAYLEVDGGTIDLTINVYDTIDTPNAVFKITGGAHGVINVASLRTQRTRLFTITGADNHIEVPKITFWNGTTTSLPASVVDQGSTLHIGNSRDTKGYVDYVDTTHQIGNTYTAGYQSTPTALRPFSHKEARIGVTSAGTSISIPLADIQSIFPNFNRPNTTYMEWLQFSVRNGTGIAYGAIVSCVNNAIVGSKTDNQTTTGNGSAAAVISGFSVSGNNLVVTFTGSVGAGAIVMMRPV